MCAFLVSRRISPVPGRIQAAIELFVSGIDDFVCGIIGTKGRKYVPFIGTLFIYILCMNLMGLVPFLKGPTADWSITLGLAVCVFVYVQYTALKEFGFLGYLDHLCGRPRGAAAFSVVMPLMMLVLHLVSEIIRPLSLSLRLRSSTWGDDMLLAALAHFGISGIPLLFFSMMAAAMMAGIQTLVFTLLTAVYFALATEDGGH